MVYFEKSFFTCEVWKNSFLHFKGKLTHQSVKVMR